jgi:hypothetical protein
MLNVDHLTKRHATVVAVDGLSFQVGPGRVTDFLGPNIAATTTTLRMLLGLAAPDPWTGTINGVLPRRALPDAHRRGGTGWRPTTSAPAAARETSGRQRPPELARPGPVTGDPAGDFADASRPRARRPW